MVARALTVVSLAALLVGCSIRMGDFTLLSSKNVGVEGEVIQRGVEGEDCVHMLLFLPLGSLNPNLEEAMDRAMAEVPSGNVMTDLAIYNDVLFTYLYNRICIRVKGDVGRIE